MNECKTNYQSEIKRRKTDEKRNVFRFPNKKKFPKEREEWIGIVSKIRADLVVTDETVLCNRHWPSDTPMFDYYGKLRPVNAPSIFDNIPQSIVPPPPPPPRTTKRTSCHKRNREEDQQKDFQAQDNITFEQLKHVLHNEKDEKGFKVAFTSLIYENRIVLQSDSFFEGIP